MSIPVIFSTGSLYPFGLDRVFGWAVEAGYDGVEIMMDDRWDTHQSRYLRELADRHGISIRALHPPIYEGVWKLPKDETLVRSAKLAGRIDCPVVVAHPPPPGRSLRRWLGGPLVEARETGVTVAVENMPKHVGGRFGIRRYKSCHRAGHLRDAGHVTLDTSHVGASGVELMEMWRTLSDRVRHVHLSDSDLSGGDQHRLPGKGKLPLEELLGELARNGYPGAVSLELKPWPLGTPDPDTILERMRYSLDFAREGLACGR